MQGKVRNYLGKQKMVRAPLHWQSGPGHPKTQLAYITKPELDLILKKDFHGSLKDGPNVGPSGIMSLNDPGTGRSGSEVSAAETGGSGHGMSAGEAAGYRSGFVAAGGRGTKDEMRAAKKEYGSRYRGQDRRSGLSGLLGGIGRGLLGFFGGIPGKVMSGILSARNLAKRTGAKIGEFGEEVEEFGNYPTLDRYLNRNTDKYKDKPYRGQGQGYNFSDTGQGNNLGLYTNTLGAPIGPGKRVGQDQGYYGTGSQYDQTRMPSNITPNMGANNFNNAVPNNELFTDNNLMAFNTGSPLDLKINQAHNIYNETGFGKGNLQDLMKMDIENKEKTGEPLSLPKSTYTMFGADGGIARLL